MNNPRWVHIQLTRFKYKCLRKLCNCRCNQNGNIDARLVEPMFQLRVQGGARSASYANLGDLVINELWWVSSICTYYDSLVRDYAGRRVASLVWTLWIFFWKLYFLVRNSIILYDSDGSWACTCCKRREWWWTRNTEVRKIWQTWELPTMWKLTFVSNLMCSLGQAYLAKSSYRFFYYIAGTGGAGPTTLGTSLLLLGEDVIAYDKGSLAFGLAVFFFIMLSE